MQKELKRKRFGAGLEDILRAGSSEVPEGKPAAGILETILVTRLSPGSYQPRRTFDEDAMRSLAESIKEKGILQPIVARKIGASDYEIIAGERRWRAAQMAGLQQVPVIIKEMTNENALAFGIIENIQRADLNPIEEALSIRRLVNEFKLTQEEVAKSLGRPRATITNMLRLLDLSDPVKKMLESGKIQVGHAKTMLTLPSDVQYEVAIKVEEGQLSVRATEALIKRYNQPKNRSMQDNKHELFFSKEFKQDIEDRLPAEVFVQMKRGGGWSVVLAFDDSVELKKGLRSLLALPLIRKPAKIG